MVRSVGPILSRSAATEAVIDAIRACTREVTVVDRGAYVRVSADRECRVSRAAIEARLGVPFRLPQDLEPIMPSFSGKLTIDAEGAVWRWRV
jgi:toluene monooxygenase system protein D